MLKELLIVSDQYFCFLIAITGRPQSSISGTVISGFSQDGLVLHSILHDVYEIRSCNIQEISRNCIYMSGKTSTIRLLNNTFGNNGNADEIAENIKNRNAVIKSVLTTYANYTLFGNIFRDNFNDIIFIPKSPRTTLKVSKNQFLNNFGVILMDFECEYSSCDVEILQNNWKNNFGRYNMMNLNIGSSGSNFSVKIVKMIENEFFNNTGGNIVNIKSISSETNVMIARNIWRNNIGQESMIRLDIGELILGTNSTFLHNVLIDNIVHEKYPYLQEFLKNEATIVYVSGKIIFHQNFLENSLSPYEFATKKLYQAEVVDARLNWWGTSNPDGILSRIFDFRSRIAVNMVNFLPFLGSKNTSNVVHDQKPTFIFAQNDKLGGPLVRSMVLGKDRSPYLVTRDVIVHPNATLVIEKGVHVKTLPYLGFDVYGKLEMIGEEKDVITFDVGYTCQGQVNESVNHLRLVKGTNSWEGLLEVFYNNTWGTVCRDGWTSTNGEVLCKQLGFQSYLGTVNMSYSSATNQPMWLKNINCKSDIHYDITKCPFEGWGVQCNYYNNQPLAVRCNPGYWRGIRFRDTAKTGELRHIKLKRGGSYSAQYLEFNFVLQFDVQRQNIRDIEIMDFGAHGMNVIVPKPDFSFKNIVVSDNKYGDGIGIQCILPFFTCYRCTVLNVKKYGLLLPSRTQFAVSVSKATHFDLFSSLVTEEGIALNLCDPRRNQTLVGEESFVILSAEYTGHTSINNECVHVLHTASQAIMTVFLESNSSSHILSISENHPSKPNTTVFTAQSNDVFLRGPGETYIRYSRERRSSGAKLKIFVQTTKGNEN